MSELQHHGIKGMKWGIRRFQNPDGTLTGLGRSRYGVMNDGPTKTKSPSGMKSEKRDAVKRYSKSYDRASRMEDEADSTYREAKSIYKSLGKTPFGRIKQVMAAQRGKGSAAAKKYLSLMDKSSDLSDASYDAWQEAKKQYKDLGRTFIERIVTVAKYDK